MIDKDFFVKELETRSDMLYRVAYTLLRNNEDCKDALQEAALKAWQKRGSLREEARFATWMTRILINECYSMRRKQPRSVPLEEAPEPAVPPPDPTLACRFNLCLKGCGFPSC